ncbi:MAG: hypothetical protein B6226_01255 [Candidatus Cloacimonetes bacterium 4572_65]|nr:MAG: hypothetical protein B6226_01255 [Candidatus Cloacimonetes bacterium 4572_65]
MTLHETLDAKMIKLAEIAIIRDCEDNIQDLGRNYDNQIISQMKEMLTKALQEKLISIIDYDKLLKELEITSFIEVKTTITNEDAYYKNHQIFIDLHRRYFKLEEKKLSYGCDEYDLDYTMESELYQWFHESPESKRDRLEGPIDRKIEQIEAEIEQLEIDDKKNYYCFLNPDKDDILKSINKFYAKHLG